MIKIANLRAGDVRLIYEEQMGMPVLEAWTGSAWLRLRPISLSTIFHGIRRYEVTAQFEVRLEERGEVPE